MSAAIKRNTMPWKLSYSLLMGLLPQRQGNGLGHGQGAAHGSGYGNGSGGEHRHQQANG